MAPSAIDPSDVLQRPLLPRRARPIVSLGAGAIVRDAHLPAYKLAGFPVACVYDLDTGKAEALARDFAIPVVARSLADAVASAPDRAVFDLAVPARAIAKVLSELPDGAAVLIQKPMGETIAEARAIAELCRGKGLLAAVNFQLRFAPCVIAARDLVQRGAIGDLHDVEVRVTCHMPWELWTFLFGIPRMEIVYHSIHYVDLVRSFFGEPEGVYCKTLKHPKQMDLASTRTAILFDYGDVRRATVTTNHGHAFGPKHQESYLKLEGTTGAIKARLGVNLDYPRGLPDALEYCQLGAADAPGEWRPIPLVGSWFPHAFVGTMASLMRRAEGETSGIPTAVEDAFRTMAVVEACYESSARGGVPVERSIGP
ncbi:MAG TPA: Gfo/Idh/MocA family oxidoreductase [Polyangiaceae bacterium]|nr:Gfo/Idh/MocA family oxidoreductase [Polyangiaceae bacterium]